MKTYSDKHCCDNCHREFTWMYKHPEYHCRGNGVYASQVISYGSDKEIKHNKLAICQRKIEIPQKLEYFVTSCPFCRSPFFFECTDDILKDLYS